MERLESEIQRAPTAELLSLLARVATDAGARSRAVQLIGTLLNEAVRTGIEIRSPTWPASAHYDSIALASDAATWLMAASAEALISLGTFSGYFSVPQALGSSLRLLDWLQKSPYVSAPMERRHQLQQLQTKRSLSIQSSVLLSRPAPGHLNAEFWRCAAAEGTTMPAGLLHQVA
jgi:hypothetical protein